jgi:thiol:disulfide interchange protein DsbD
MQQRITVSHQLTDQTISQARITFHLKDQEFLYKNRIEASVDHQAVTVNDFEPCQDAVKKYDQMSKQTVLCYRDQPSFVVHLNRQQDEPVDAYLHILYHVNTDGAPTHIMHHLSFGTPVAAEQSPVSKAPNLVAPRIQSDESSGAHQAGWSWSQSISDLIQTTKSIPLRLIFVFFLGLLLSLTPCIYPMIPITVGILHAQKSSSVGGNFARAGAYTLGLATTFALLGLAASYTGPIYGKLLVHPVSVAIIVSLLAYMGLSMMGFFELSIPRFLQTAGTTRSSGTLVSAFLFGTASGTIASPCVSPGLILLLSIVATMGSMLMGFLFLFTFGVGLSMPLLIIGTFSSSLSLLPQAGMWMVEIKKLFGILLFGVCFYYLATIISWPIVTLAAAFFTGSIGLMYLLSKGAGLSTIWRTFNNLLGMSLLVCSVFLLAESYQSWLATPTENFWETDYAQARERALKENKKMFIDFWARYCSICKKINNSILADAKVREALSNYIPVKLDGTDESSPAFKELKKKFGIVGYPAFMIVDPRDEKIIVRWSSELHTMPYDEFIESLYKRFA